MYHIQQYHKLSASVADSILGELNENDMPLYQGDLQSWPGTAQIIPPVQGIPVVKGFVCPICSSSFATSSSLEKHVYRNHPDQKRILSSNIDMDAFVQSLHFQGHLPCFPVAATDISQASQDTPQLATFLLQNVPHDSFDTAQMETNAERSSFIRILGWEEIFKNKNTEEIIKVKNTPKEDSRYGHWFSMCKRYFDFCTELIHEQSHRLLEEIGGSDRFVFILHISVYKFITHQNVPFLYRMEGQDSVSSREYFQPLQREASKVRYSDTLARFIILALDAAKNNIWGIFDQQQQSLLANIQNESCVFACLQDPDPNAEIQLVSMMCQLLFLRTFSSRKKRCDEPVFVLWSCFALDEEVGFSAPKSMTNSIAALMYCIRLSVVYFESKETEES